MLHGRTGVKQGAARNVALSGSGKSIAFGIRPPFHAIQLHDANTLRLEMRSRSRTSAPALPGLTFVEGYIEVESIEGMRLHMDGETPRLDYLVKWKVKQQHDSCCHAQHGLRF